MLRPLARLAALLAVVCLLAVGLVIGGGDRRLPVAVYVHRAIDPQHNRTETIIYLEDVQTGRQLVLHREPGWFRVSVSPHSARAVMWDTSGSNSDVFTVNLISGRKQMVIQNVFVRFRADPTWSRTGNQFAFVVIDAGFFRDSVAVIDLRDGSTAYVSSGGDGSAQPTFSPDGNRVIYVAPQGWERELFRWDGANTTAERIIDGEYDINPAWSPQGDKVVYTSRRENMDQLYLLDIASGEETHLMRDPSVRDGAAAVWSPDGRYIAYTARESIAAPRRLYLIDTHDDNRVWRLMDTDSDDASYLAWSADGRWLAFRADLDRTGMRTYMVNIDTGDLLPLATDNAAGLEFAGFAGWH